MSKNRIFEIFSGGKWLFLSMILLIFISILVERETKNRVYSVDDTEKFRKVLISKEEEMDKLLEDVLSEAGSLSFEKLIPVLSVKYSDLLKKKGMGIFVYLEDSLVFWSDNSIPVPALFSDFPAGKALRISNSFFVRKEKISENIIISGLILIKRDYPYENRFLENGFSKDFNLSKDVRLMIDQLEPGINSVYSKEGEFLFSLDYNMAKKWDKIKMITSISMYCLAFIVFLLFIRGCFIQLIKRYGNYLFFILILFLALIFFGFHYYRIPDIIFHLDLFSPERFAQSALLPSLGDLLILSVLFLYAVVFFYSEVEINHEILLRSSWKRFFVLLFSGIVILIWYRFTFSLFKSLILDSTISFQVFKILDISVHTLIGFLILGLNFVSLAMLIDKIFSVMKKIHCRTEALIFIILINANILALLIPSVNKVPLESAIFFFITSLIFFCHKFYTGFHYHLSNYILYVILFSSFTVFEVIKFSERKAKADMKIRAVNLSTEHDPVAELLFVDIDKRLNDDEELRSIILSDDMDPGLIYSLLQKKYFTGFWDKYDLQITPCKTNDSLYVLPPEDKKYHCYEYFNQNILKDALPVPNTNFYYLDNLNGRISYFSSRLFEKDEDEITLFIELDTRLISEGLGYPELLLEEKMTLPYSDIKYSYSKYNRGRLITYSGNFPYYMTSLIYTDGTEGFSFLRKDNYDHLIYNMDKDNTIIVSKPAVFWVDILISLSYIFAFYLIGLVLLILIINRNPFFTGFQWNFKNKIQASVTALLLFSLLFVGFGTVYFSINQYRNKHVELLKEKMQSVYVELIHKLEFENDLHNWQSDEYYNLDGLLGMLSNVIYTDINLYDTRGELLASSRPEVYKKDLIAPRMNTVAYSELVLHQRAEYTASENIGGLNYLSSYVPFVNSENKLLAFVNLPYFTRQDELSREITNLIVAIVNILVLLSLLILTVAVFISNKITQPLRLIQEKFRMINLRGKNEKIDYKAKDEIGGLINAYNEMVLELSKNVEMIARSERESAWREMAKQIAHEIKNPLTPMRLSIQHLERTWKDKSKDRDEQLERISKIIIEQIDNLSAIATEFSNFAKMPHPNNEKLNLVVQLKSIIELFDNTENVSIELNLNGLSEVYVFADKEQLSRVFINLIKNAIQAAQEVEKSEVTVSLNATSEKVNIKVRDNGKGIPEEIRNKLFQPNFTTKSSGMGMGLAIVKNIVKNAGGDVHYKTEINKGTVFTVELPVYKSNEIKD